MGYADARLLFAMLEINVLPVFVLHTLHIVPKLLLLGDEAKDVIFHFHDEMQIPH